MKSMTDDHCSRKTCTNIMGKSYQKSNGFLACLQFFKWETDIEKLWLNFGRIWIKFRPVFAKNLGNWSNYEHGDNSRKCSNFGKFSQRFHYMKDALWYQQWKKNVECMMRKQWSSWENPYFYPEWRSTFSKHRAHSKHIH